MIKMEFVEYLFFLIVEIKNEMIFVCIFKYDNLKENFFFKILDVDYCVFCMIIRYLLCIYKCLFIFFSS